MVRSYLGRGHDAARQRSSEYCLTEKPVTDNAPIRAAHPREHASSLMPCPVEHAAAFHTGGRRHIAMSKNLSASAGRKLTYASATEFAVDAARAFAGALIFALPMLMTMEMWWLGFYIDPLRLALLLVLMFPLLVRLSQYSGIRRPWLNRATIDVSIISSFPSRHRTLARLLWQRFRLVFQGLRPELL
jgi:hypothetical protein